MHILKDENGNPIPHGGHDHDHEAPKSMDQMKKLLDYMYHHNVEHAEELHDMAHDLEHAGKKEASDQVHKAVDLMNESCEVLKKALESL